MNVDAILEDIFMGRQRLTRDEILRRTMAAEAPGEVTTALCALPEGEYAEDEVADALDQIGTLQPDRAPPSSRVAAGVPGNELSDADLLRQMGELHRTRDDTLRHGSDNALTHHDDRLGELEGEYLRRFPRREIDPDRVRPIRW